MKKVVSVILILSLLITTVFSVSVFPVSASTANDYLNNYENWQMFWANGEKEIPGYDSDGDGTTISKIGNIHNNSSEVMTIKADNTYGRTDNSSILLSGWYHYSYIMLPDIKANKEYTLTFYYSGETKKNDCLINAMYLFAPTVSGGAIGYNANGSLFAAGTNYAYTTTDGLIANKTNLASSYQTANTSVTAGIGNWNKVEITFNSGNLTTLALAFLLNGNQTDATQSKRWIDDITLTENVYDQNNTPSLWTVYDSNTTSIGPDGSIATWVGKKYNTTDTDCIYPGKKGVMQFTTAAYQKLSTFLAVEKNKDYIISLKYMSPDTPKTANNVSYHLSNAIVLPTGGSPKVSTSSSRGDVISAKAYNFGYINKAESNNYSYTCSVDADAPNDWYELTLEFNSGDNEEVAFSMTAGSGNIYLCDFAITEIEKPLIIDFEDETKWGKGGNGSKQLEGYSGYVAPEPYVTVTKNTNTAYVKEGASSVQLNTQTRWFDYKLEGLKANTKYALKFSYATNEMKSSLGAAQTTVLGRYGIFNYAAEGANLSAASYNKPSGFLHLIDTKYYCVMDDDGIGTPSYTSYSVRRIISDDASQGIAEVANTWYDTILYFNTGSVNETLAFVVNSSCAKTYLDDFELIELKDDVKVQEYFAPAVEGKTATGSYDTENATTTLYENVTEADFEGYKITLANANFEEYALNAYGNNKFATYVKGNTTVNVTYTPNNSTMLIAEQVTDTLPARAEDNVYTDKGYQPLIIQLDHNNATGGGIGMSYIIRLADGSFIIVDGGHTETYFDNANRLYKLLREYTPEGDIQIAAWFFTHCHGDHISGFSSFLERYGAQVNVEQIIYNFPTYEQNVYGKNSDLVDYKGFEFFDVIVKLNPDIKISTCHSGYKYNIRNAVIDIMYTLEDNFPKVLGYTLSDVNNTSTTFKISFTDKNVDQTLLITGDSAGEQCSGMLKKYSNNELESTFVQAIHHGIAYGSYELYSKMNPEVVLWPASASRLMDVLSENQNSYFVKEDSVKEVVCSDYGTRVFALPYTAPEGLTGMSKFTLPAELDVNANPINSYVGVSIRQAGESGTSAKQALRFKFQIPEHIVKAHTEDCYSVAEYGMMVSVSNANLNYYEGSNVYVTTEDGKKVFKGVAYNKSEDKNIVFDYVDYPNSTNGTYRSVQYTCALYNIGGLSNGTTDYTKYDTTYYVRSYITFKNANGDTKVYYGDTKSASVFAVMQTILSSTATDDQTANDKAYVKNFLDGKVAGFEADAIAIKEAWIKDSTRASLYTPAN